MSEARTVGNGGPVWYICPTCDGQCNIGGDKLYIVRGGE